MSEHTSIPWEAVPAQMGGALLIRPIPAGVYAGQRMIQIVPFEDAEFIVQAVNSHDALVKALKRVLSIGPMGCYCGLVDSSIQCATCQANAALKAAGEL